MKLLNKLSSCFTKLVTKLINSLSQGEKNYSEGDKKYTEGMAELARAAASEGIVLLENKCLPLSEKSKVSVFGRVQIDYFYTGYGSGGDVNTPYKINLAQGIINCDKLTINEELYRTYQDWIKENPVNHGYWGNWPRFYPEMPIDEETVKRAAKNSDCALVVIGRSSGEDRENVLEKGSFYITDEELTLLDKVTGAFDNTILLLNIGSIMDMSWMERYKDRLGAVLIVWQGGMESGNAIADVLCGDFTPSGRLTDTIALNYKDYPSANDFGAKDYNNYTEDIYVGYRWFETFNKEAVLYPFGYGLSYTQFDKQIVSVNQTDNGFKVTVNITNTGERAGKETALIYVSKPIGRLGNPSRELVAFAKTEVLVPKESQKIDLVIDNISMASYDDSGVSNNKSCYLMQAGKYEFYLGGSVREAVAFHSFILNKDEVLIRLSEAAAPVNSFERAVAYISNEGIKCRYEKAPLSTVDLRNRILKSLPQTIELTGDKGYKLSDVKNGAVTMEQFVAQLSLTELEALSRGDYTMNSPLGAKGNAGAYGGKIKSLRDKGVPPIITTDGPSGIRLSDYCSLVPIGTLLASTFNYPLIKSLYNLVGQEMRDRGTNVLLAPGMNIHRNPLCGRNFEYFSEDPYVSGIITAAIVSGVQEKGAIACPKHFACNNQEFNRNNNDSRVSERALREIYLKGFQICIERSNPKNIMTSYNKINGIWGHYHYDLCTTILRDEWKYQGCVITDWWMRPSYSPEFPKIRNNAYRVRAQVDVLMPGGGRAFARRKDKTLLETVNKPDGITLGELQRTAINVLNIAMDLI